MGRAGARRKQGVHLDPARLPCPPTSDRASPDPPSLLGHFAPSIGAGWLSGGTQGLMRERVGCGRSLSARSPGKRSLRGSCSCSPVKWDMASPETARCWGGPGRDPSSEQTRRMCTSYPLFPSTHPNAGRLPSSQEQPARPLTLPPATSIPAAPRALRRSFSSTLHLTLGVQVSGSPSRCQPAPP